MVLSERALSYEHFARHPGLIHKVEKSYGNSKVHFNRPVVEKILTKSTVASKNLMAPLEDIAEWSCWTKLSTKFAMNEQLQRNCLRLSKIHC